MLVAGAVLSPGKRTITQALRVMGLADQPGFRRYHEALSRARWDSREVARRLLIHLLAALWPSGEVVSQPARTIASRCAIIRCGRNVGPSLGPFGRTILPLDQAPTLHRLRGHLLGDPIAIAITKMRKVELKRSASIRPFRSLPAASGRRSGSTLIASAFSCVTTSRGAVRLA